MQRKRLFLQTLLFVVVLRRQSVECIKDSKLNVSAHIPGDVVLGGLFSIHRSDFGLECKQWSNAANIQRVEAMLYAIDMINKNPSILPNITLGADIRDDCYSGTVALEQSLNFILNAFSQNGNICSAQRQSRSRVVGVVGTSSSGTSLSVASLLRLFRLPQVSYAATSSDLNNRDDYGYFTRTVPDDEWQAEALIDVINYLNWTAVHLISSPGNYGQRLQEAFVHAAKNNSLCIVSKMKLHVKRKDSWEQLDKFLQDMNKIRTVRGVVLLTEQFHTRVILERISNITNTTGIRHDRFVWLGTDTWGTERTFLHGLETIADGAITIALHAAKREVVRNFSRYLDGLRSGNNSRNPWYGHYLSEMINSTRGNAGNDTGRGIYFDDDKMPYILDAVYALAYSLDHMLRNSCSSANLSECLRQPIGSHDLLDYLLQTNFSGASGMVSFDSHGNGVSRYDIMSYINGTYKRIAVWNRGQSLSLNLPEFYQRKKRDMLLESSCTTDCGVGEVRIIFPGTPSCCWKCKKCSESQYVDSDRQCQSCPKEERTNQNRTGCEALPEGHPALVVVIVLSVWASMGIVMVAFVAFTVFKFYSTPIIMASGRELMLLLLVGIGLCHSLGFCLLASPNRRRCAYQRYGTGLSLAVCYSAILVKTNRIARIFRGNHRPAFITPAPQLVITALLVCVQLVICLIASNFGSSLEVTHYYSEVYVFSICRTSGMEYLVSIGYNVLLLLLCTCYAFLTRKLPANFNEAKIVGITMYATCVLWIFFLPLFYGTEPLYQTAVLHLNSCFNATVLLVGIFGHKVYVVWYRPEKNTRMASNPRKRSHSVISGSVHVETLTMYNRDCTKDIGMHSMSRFSSNVTLQSNISYP